MDEKNHEIHVDYTGLINQLTSKVISNIFSDLMPDDKSKKLIEVFFESHRRHGIDAATSLKILMDIAKHTEEPKNE